MLRMTSRVGLGPKFRVWLGSKKLNSHIQLCEIFADFDADTLYATESYTLLYTLAYVVVTRQLFLLNITIIIICQL